MVHAGVWRRAVSSVAGLAILFASDGLMASYAHLQRCSLAELKLGGLAVVWDNVSAAGLSPVAIVDFAGKWAARDAERLRTQDIERCRFVPARLREDCRQASRASQAVSADLEAAADERPGAAAAASATVAAHSQAQLKRIVRRGDPSVFSAWGRRLQWLQVPRACASARRLAGGAAAPRRCRRRVAAQRCPRVPRGSLPCRHRFGVHA